MKLRELRSINSIRDSFKKKDQQAVNLYKYAHAFISSSETILADRESFLKELKKLILS